MQKRACKIIESLQDHPLAGYNGYNDALHKLNLRRFENQHQDLNLQFGQKLSSNPRHRNLPPARQPSHCQSNTPS